MGAFAGAFKNEIDQLKIESTFRQLGLFDNWHHKEEEKEGEGSLDFSCQYCNGNFGQQSVSKQWSTSRQSQDNTTSHSQTVKVKNTVGVNLQPGYAVNLTLVADITEASVNFEFPLMMDGQIYASLRGSPGVAHEWSDLVKRGVVSE